MRIKRIEIEGFKSYAQRQVVDNLDSQFNAITGLNGSGKSNILDAICFLLGITNLSQVRAHNLSDLVYKQGQAGINRATVTITFDNTDESNQPVGYNKFKEIVIRRQIIINGRNTYQINGSAATNSRVSDLFRMVGMNVNNPHFLIMQGRITKVLNMKPHEILSMVEEAAGVRMYECKKQSAIKTIEKKEGKVAEICKLMDEDILPRVEKLKRDRANYLEFQKIGRDIEIFERKLIAYDFHNSLGQVEKLEAESVRKMEEAQEVGREIQEKVAWADQEQKSYDKMEKEKSKTMSAEREALEKEVAELQVELAKVESDRDGKESAQKDLRVNIDRKKKALNADKKELDKKRAELSKKENEIGGEERRGKNAEEKLAKARLQLEALAKGLTTDDEGNAVTLDAQITATRSQLSQLETDVKRAEIRLKQLKPSLLKKKNELQSMARRSDTDGLKKEHLEEEIAQLKERLAQMDFDEEAETKIDEERRQLCRERMEVGHAVDNFDATYHYLSFKYTDPAPNFDRSSVKGVVAKLFRMRDPKFATALEVAAGGKIHNIIVDRAQTAQALLQFGKLNRRVTIIPLDKIDRGGMPHQRLAEARRMVGADNVFLAKEVIEYDPELEPAMQNVFGNVLICSNMDVAKRLTFDQNVRTRSVTISGEDFRPTGVLSGGSRPAKSAMLSDWAAISSKCERIDQIDSRIREIDSELARLQPLRQEYEQLKSNLNASSKRLLLVVESLKRSPVQVLKDEIKQLEEEIPEAEALVADSRPKITALSEKIKMLGDRKKDEKAYQDKEKKQAQKDQNEAQKELDGLKDTFSNIKEILAALREEITTLEGTIQEDEEEMAAMTEKLDKSKSEMDSASDVLNEAKGKVKKAQAKLESYNKEMRSHDKAMRSKATEIEELRKQVKQLEAKEETLQKESQDAIRNSREYAGRAQKLEKQHKWITDEKRHFGGQGTTYEFTGYNYETGKREIEAAKDRRKELESTINTKAMHLLGTAEEQCRELEKKRGQLEKDKKQLYDAIKQLDAKKCRELIAAHEQISQDFGSIFSTLLPGTSAKLTPPSGAKSCLEGLEVKIAFNNKWKESLGELSGGQRSLVALSLILAMLKFKPAPIYILDEVDAALDMSHTQNIGAMIKKHFKESQFIIVSLKDGMFNNANVLYRTKFVDGTSTVTRIENC